MYPYIKPGFLEIYTGPMGSYKSGRIIDRLDNLIIRNQDNYIAFKPAKEKRDPGVIKSRNMLKILPCETFQSSFQIVGKVTDKHKVVVIDEVNLADETLPEIVKKLIKDNKNVILGGLNLNFRGQPNKIMAKLLPLADYIDIRPAVCYCGHPANRTQMFISGKPAPYSTPDDIVGDINSEDLYTYEPRCLEHHIVPRIINKK
jgi:thymidine kinase